MLSSAGRDDVYWVCARKILRPATARGIARSGTIAEAVSRLAGRLGNEFELTVGLSNR